jgi:cation diffusion facilitator family transporter
MAVLASALNFAVARILLRVGREHESATLEADAQHLLSDVWTSVGVVLGIGAVAVTGWHVLDPLVAIVVALQIGRTGIRLTRSSLSGLMDTALPAAEEAAIAAILERYETDGVHYHALRTRRAGARRFVSVHIQVPGIWTVQQGHTLLEKIEREIRGALPRVAVFTHLEPVEDPASWDDVALLREELGETKDLTGRQDPSGLDETDLG